MPTYYLDEICDQVRRRGAGAPVTIVAVDGPSGAGKSRFSKRLSSALGAAQLLHTDDMVPGWDGLAELPGVLRDMLTLLRLGAPGHYREWDWHASRPGELITVQPRDYLVLEGCGAGSPAAEGLVHMVIWMEAPVHIRRTRALERDGAMYEPHWQRWADQEAAVFAQYGIRERADLVIDGRAPVRRRRTPSEPSPG